MEKDSCAAKGCANVAEFANVSDLSLDEHSALDA